ncbi:hypothetical protein EDD17DRAFT_1475129, partial [Pisolithus thermaeus]
DLKDCAIHLWDSGWEIEDVCAALGVSSSSCYCWQWILAEHGSWEWPPSPLTRSA